MPGKIIPLAKDQNGEAGFRLIVPMPRDTATGKRKQKWVTLRGGSRRDAERELARLYTEGARGGAVTSARLTVAVYLQTWLKDSVTERVSFSTAKRYREHLAHLLPYIGSRKLSTLTALNIQHAYARLRDPEGPHQLSAKTTLNVHRVLHSALKQAMRWGYVDRNVAALTDPPRPQKYEAVILTPADVVRVLEATDKTHYGPIYRLLTYTGMRVGEALALRWEDLDLEVGKAYIRHSVRRVNGKGLVIGKTKTARSTRPVPLSAEAVELLRLLRLAQRHANGETVIPLRTDALVFTTASGKAICSSDVSKAWRLTVRELGYNARVHDLRHAFATFALRGGVAVKVVSEILGHSQTSITENLYTSVLPGLKEDAVSAVAALLSNANRLEVGLEAEG